MMILKKHKTQKKFGPALKHHALKISGGVELKGTPIFNSALDSFTVRYFKPRWKGLLFKNYKPELNQSRRLRG
jgi:hypothetical protein